MTNEGDSFLAGLDEVKEDPFKSETEDPLNLTVKEEKKVDEKVELPFHKDPKIQKFIDREIKKALNERISDRPTETERFTREVVKDEDPLTDVLTRVIGNDTPEKVSAIKDFKRALDSRDERVRAEALREIDSRVDEEREAEIDAQNELIQGFEDIEETFNVDITSNTPQAKTIRGEFVDFIKRVAPKDEDGQVTEYPDLEQTFQLFQDMKKVNQAPNRAKELASRSMNRGGDASALPEEKDTSWRGVEKVFGKLFK
jgi:hypothetical protein